MINIEILYLYHDIFNDILMVVGKVVSILLTARELIDPVFLDAVNSLLVSGEYAHIFSNDELEGLLQVIIVLFMYHKCCLHLYCV